MCFDKFYFEFVHWVESFFECRRAILGRLRLFGDHLGSQKKSKTCEKHISTTSEAVYIYIYICVCFATYVSKLGTYVSKLETHVSKFTFWNLRFERTCLYAPAAHWSGNRSWLAATSPCVSKGDGLRFETCRAFFVFSLRFTFRGYVSVCFEASPRRHAVRFGFTFRVTFRNPAFHVARSETPNTYIHTYIHTYI